MGYVTISQVFKPGGVNGTAGTPNFLRSIDDACVLVDWTLIQIGGLQIADFQMKKPYEDTTDLVAGNWIYFAIGGGTLASSVGSGASSISVTGLGDPTDARISGANQADIRAGDWMLISDGANTDLMQVSSVTGSGPWTINLAAAPGQGTATTLNAYLAGATVARLQFSGYLQARDTRTTELTNKYVLKAAGFATRYNNVLCNATIVEQDSATSIYNLASSYAPTLPEIIVNSANFAAANSILASTSGIDQKVMKVITDIIKTENSHDANTNYGFWVDAARQVHHALIPGANTGTPTGTLGQVTGTLGTPTFTIDLSNSGSVYGDVIGPLQTTDMDMSHMVNTAKVTGGKTSSKQRLSIIVQDVTSQNAWGYWEGTLSNPDLTDQATAAAWGAGQLALTAYPLTTAKATLTQASARLGCWDLLEVTGFTDSSVIQLNPTQIKYTADHRKRLITASLDLSQARPDIGSIMNAGANEVALRAAHGAESTNVSDAFVVSGCDISTSGTTATISAGVVSYGGATYSIPQSAFTIPDLMTIEIGAQVGGTPPAGVTLPSSVEMPNVTALSKMHALNVFSVARPATAGSPITITQETNFVGVPLWTVHTGVATILGTFDDRVFGGVGATNLTPPTSGSPSLTATSVTVTAEGAASAMATLDFTLNGIVADLTMDSVLVTWSLAGQNQWHPPIAAQRNIYTLSFPHPFVAYIHGLAAGQAYDVGVYVSGFNGATLPPTAPMLLGTSPTISAAAITAAIANWNDFGGTQTTTGAWTGVDGHSSHTAYSIGSPQPVLVVGTIIKGATGSVAELILGNETNGYGVEVDGSGNLYISKFVAGVGTTIAGPVAVTNDLNAHSFRLTVQVVSGVNYIEGGVDQHYIAATDSAVNLETGTWPITVYTGGSTGTLAHFAVSATTSHFGGLPPNVQNPLIPPWDGGAPADGSTLRSGVVSARHMIGAPSTDTGALFDSNGYALHTRMSGGVQDVVTSAGGVNVNPVGGVSGNMPYANHAASLQDGVFQKNLVVNGNNCAGSGALVPSTFGWTGSYSGGTCVNGGAYNVDGAALVCIEVNSAINSGVYQDIPVVPGQMYTFCALVFSGGANQGTLFIGNAAFTVRFNATVGVPDGSLGQFYSANTGTINGNTAPVGSGWQVLYGTFTIPSGYYSARVLLQNLDNGGAVFFQGVMVTQGTRLQDYIDHELNPGAVDLTRHITATPLPYTSHSPVITGAIDTGGIATPGAIDFTRAYTNKILDNIGDGSTYARVKGTELATGTVKQLNDGTNIRTVANVAALINANSSINSSNGNMLPNSDFAISGDAPPSPSTGAVPKFWAPYNNASVDFIYEIDNSSALGAPPFGANAWVIENNSGANTTSSMGLYCGTNNIDGSANQVLYANKTYVFSFYAAAVIPNIGFEAASNTGITISNLPGFTNYFGDTAWHRYAFLITVGSANYTGGIFMSITPSTPITNTDYVAFAAPQLEEGSILSAWSGPSPSGGTAIDFALPHPNRGALALKNQANLPTDVTGVLPYANADAATTTVLDSSGNLKASTTFLKNTPNNLSSMLSDVLVHYSSTTSSVSLWFTNQAGSGYPTWTPPDGSPAITVPAAQCGTSASPKFVLSGLASGATAYFIISYILSTQTLYQNYASTTFPTDADIAAALADGSLLAVIAGTTSGAFVANGGSGTVPGGGGHGIHD